MRLTALLLMLFLVGCAGPQAVAPPQERSPMEVTNVEQAEAARGEEVQIVGIARNAKLSALLQGPGLSVYCIDEPEWPAPLVGQTIRVTGRLERSDAFTARRDPDGAISAGTEGPVWVVHDIAYRVVE